MWKIKDNNVIGGDKVTTPFGSLIFERIHVTEDAKIAEYFSKKHAFSVTEIAEDDNSVVVA